MEGVNIDLLDCRHTVGGVGVLDFEQATGVNRNDAYDFTVWVCDLAGFVLALEEDVVASIHDAADGDNGERHVGRMESFAKDDGSG